MPKKTGADKMLKVDHIGYAVKNIEKARETFEEIGFRFEELFHDTARNVDIVFGEKDGYRIELIAPLDRSMESPVDGVLGKNGPTAYHLCYAAEDLEAEMEKLKTLRFRPVTEPAPAVAFGGRRVVFLMNLAIGLMEIVEE